MHGILLQIGYFLRELSKRFKKVNFISLSNRMSSVCHSHITYVIPMSLICTCMSFVCHSYVLVCYSYVTRMRWYVIRMSLVCGFTMNRFKDWKKLRFLTIMCMWDDYRIFSMAPYGVIGLLLDENYYMWEFVFNILLIEFKLSCTWGFNDRCYCRYLSQASNEFELVSTITLALQEKWLTKCVSCIRASWCHLAQQYNYYWYYKYRKSLRSSLSFLV